MFSNEESTRRNEGEITSVDYEQRAYETTCSDGDSEDMWFEDQEMDLVVQREAIPLTRTAGNTERPTRSASCKSTRRYQHLAHGNHNQKLKARDLNASIMQSLEWKPSVSMLKTFDGQQTLLNMLKTYDFDEGTTESWHPLALAAKANDADAPNWNQAMSRR